MKRTCVCWRDSIVRGGVYHRLRKGTENYAIGFACLCNHFQSQFIHREHKSRDSPVLAGKRCDRLGQDDSVRNTYPSGRIATSSEQRVIRKVRIHRTFRLLPGRKPCNITSRFRRHSLLERRNCFAKRKAETTPLTRRKSAGKLQPELRRMAQLTHFFIRDRIPP